MAKSQKNTDDPGLLKGVMFTFLILIGHLFVLVLLGIVVLFFRGVSQHTLLIFLGGLLLIGLSGYFCYRRIKARGKKTLEEVMSSPVFKDRNVEVSFMGGLASIKVGHSNTPLSIENTNVNPPLQLEDFESARIRELTELARMLEQRLITQEEYNQVKRQILDL